MKMIGESNPSHISLRYLPYVPPLSLVLINSEKPNGVLHFGIHSLGRSTGNRVLRIGTVVRREVFPDLFEHLVQLYENAWERSTEVAIFDT